MAIVCWALLIIRSMLNMYGVLKFGCIPIHINYWLSLYTAYFFALVLMWLGLNLKSHIYYYVC
jgi:hypothetical protein